MGETHSDMSPKKILMENMDKLKELGVKRIYLEHLMKDTQSEMLTYYFDSPDNKMPRMLEDYLRKLDKGQRCEQHYGFYDLVVSAKRAGIEVIPFDTRASYGVPSRIAGQDKRRYVMMNYLAKKALDEYENDSGAKYVMLCGSAHVNYMSQDVPGIAQLAGVPCVVVEDKEPTANTQASADDHKAKPDFLAIFDKADKTGNLQVLRSTPQVTRGQSQTMFQPAGLNDKTTSLIASLGGKRTKFKGKEGEYLVFAVKSQYEAFIANPVIADLIKKNELRISNNPQTVMINDFKGLNSWAETCRDFTLRQGL